MGFSGIKSKIQKNIKLIYDTVRKKDDAMSNFNKDAYDMSDMAEYYRSQSHLFRPEETLLDDLRGSLGSMKMLDIGVGGGRTTCHFASLAAEYTGVDYSPNMIRVCEERFRGEPFSFKVVDVRSMDSFQNGNFDIILFSFNGIDYIIHEERLRALSEIRRICKKSGLFFFSTHNLQSIDRLFRFKQEGAGMFAMMKHFLLLRLSNRNPKRLKREKYAVINDGSHNYSIRTYYITPREQIRQLEETGFSGIRVFSFADGKEVSDLSMLDEIEDDWLYYLCAR